MLKTESHNFAHRNSENDPARRQSVTTATHRQQVATNAKDSLRQGPRSSVALIELIEPIPADV